MAERHEVDLAIIGAGPAGLYATYYAGFRGMSVAVIDSLPEAGGQIAALYPEKAIYDIAGLPAVRGQELVDALLTQAATAKPTFLLGQSAVELTCAEDHVLIGTDTGTQVRAAAVLLTAGIGTFTPGNSPSATTTSAGGCATSCPGWRNSPARRSSWSAAATPPSTGRWPWSRTPAASPWYTADRSSVPTSTASANCTTPPCGC